MARCGYPIPKGRFGLKTFAWSPYCVVILHTEYGIRYMDKFVRPKEEALEFFWRHIGGQ
jgi:hypothetical protein